MAIVTVPRGPLLGGKVSWYAIHIRVDWVSFTKKKLSSCLCSLSYVPPSKETSNDIVQKPLIDSDGCVSCFLAWMENSMQIISRRDDENAFRERANRAQTARSKKSFSIPQLWWFSLLIVGVMEIFFHQFLLSARPSICLPLYSKHDFLLRRAAARFWRHTERIEIMFRATPLFKCV